MRRAQDAHGDMVADFARQARRYRGPRWGWWRLQRDRWRTAVMLWAVLDVPPREAWRRACEVWA